MSGSTTRLAVDRDRPGVGGLRAGERLDQRRLAGAVVADERDDLAGVDLEVDVLERRHAAEALREPSAASSITPHPTARQAATSSVETTPDRARAGDDDQVRELVLGHQLRGALERLAASRR